MADDGSIDLQSHFLVSTLYIFHKFTVDGVDYEDNPLQITLSEDITVIANYLIGYSDSAILQSHIMIRHGLQTHFIIRHTDAVALQAHLIVKNISIEDLQIHFIVNNASIRDLQAHFNSQSTIDLQTHFIIISICSLPAHLITRHTNTMDLQAHFIERKSDIVDLQTHLVTRNTMTVNLQAHFNIQPICYEYYNVNDDISSGIYGIYWQGQTFTVGAIRHTITSVKLKMYRIGNPGTMTVSIRATSGAHPAGEDLTVGTINANLFTTDSAGAWYEISVTELALSANMKYAIVFRAISGNYPNNYVKFRHDYTSPTYAGGNWEDSSDSGGTWTTNTGRDIMFEVWGKSLLIIDLQAHFVIKNTLTKDLQAHLITQATVDLQAHLITRHAGFVDLQFCFIVKNASAENLQSRLIIRHTDTIDLQAHFTSQLTANLQAHFVVLLGHEALQVGFVVRHPGLADLQSHFSAQTMINLQSHFIVRHADALDFQTNLIVRHSGSADLKIHFISQPVANLQSRFVIRKTIIIMPELKAKMMVIRTWAELKEVFKVRQLSMANIFGVFIAALGSSRQLKCELIVEQESSEDLPVEFIIKGNESMDLPSEFRSQVSLDLEASFNISNHLELKTHFNICQFEDLQAHLFTRFSGLQNLQNSFKVRQGVENTSIYNYSLDNWINFVEGAGSGFINPPSIAADPTEEIFGIPSTKIESIFSIHKYEMIRFGWTSEPSNIYEVTEPAPIPPDPDDLKARFWVRKKYNFSDAVGIAFYWKGAGITEGHQLNEVQMWSPTGGWIGHFADGPSEWRWILMPFEDRDSVSSQRLVEVDLGDSKAEKDQMDEILWAYFTYGLRRLGIAYIWYGLDLKSCFILRKASLNDLQAHFILRQEIKDLQTHFVVLQGAGNLQAHFIVRHSFPPP